MAMSKIEHPIHRQPAAKLTHVIGTEMPYVHYVRVTPAEMRKNADNCDQLAHRFA